MTRLFLLFFSFVLFALSLLQFHKTDVLIFWKLSIVTTELGHWLGVVTLTLALICAGLGFRSKINLLNFVILSLTTIFFFCPAAEMQLNKTRWSKELATTFGHGEPLTQIAVPSLSQLWFGGLHHDSPIVPLTLPYKVTPGATLMLDAYLPKQPHAPWVVVIHGGGWTSGDRKQLPELNSILASEGYAVFSIDYRLAPKWHWPAPREDVFDAVKFIKQNSEKFNVDPDRWALLGRSAGAQIAESCGFQIHDPTLKGIISFYGPSDMEFAYKWGREDDILASRQVLRDFLGGTPEQFPQIYRDASALNFVGQKSPPVLQLHGPLDPLVWVMHSRRLDEKLKSFGIPSLLIELPWATHAFDYSLKGPGGEISTFAVSYFLGKELK